MKLKIILKVCLLGLYLSFFSSCSENQEKAQGPTSSNPPEYMMKGQIVYRKNCLACHQANGGGVPGMNPPLRNTDYVLGDKNRLLDIIINGSNKGLEVNGKTYSNAMPAHDFLSDEEIAAVSSYIRNSFENEADAITTKEVSAFKNK